MFLPQPVIAVPSTLWVVPIAGPSQGYYIRYGVIMLSNTLVVIEGLGHEPPPVVLLRFGCVLLATASSTRDSLLGTLRGQR